MKQAGRLLLALTLALALAPASGAKEPRRPRAGVGTANPSELVAVEIAFNRRAVEKGQWTAFREFAAKDAVMFVPQPVNARDWLKGQADPAQSVAWQPYEVWMSCDGTLGVTRGAWQRPDGSVGYFTTAWRQQTGGRRYLWEMDQGDTLAEPLRKREFLEARVADCSRARPDDAPPAPAGAQRRSGLSEDGTLGWRVDVAADGARRLVVRRWTGQGFEDAMTAEVAAPAATGG